MYLREYLLENVGPLELVDLTLPFDGDDKPKPIVLVGRNGSGKSIILSHIVDALIEFAKTAYQDILTGQGSLQSPYFKIVGGTNQRTGTEFGISLLQFSDGDSTHCYIDKSGVLDPESYKDKMGSRFPAVTPWTIEGNHKAAPIPEDYARRFFKGSSVCYFPSARHERPHWLNVNSINDEPIFHFAENLSDKLYKPVIVESAAQANKQWLMDVMLDSMAEIIQYVEQSDPPELRYQILSNTEHLMLLKQSRSNVETLLKNVLEDPSAHLRLSYRTVSPNRLYVQKSSGYIPSLDHLSSGQANLFNLFATIIRYADRGDINKSIQLNEIEGIVLVDEIESQAHSDLQYEVLPKLLKLFPKIQFILTSHSPLFLLGMEKEYSREGFQIIDMPSGQTITADRFSEFHESWKYYRSTATYEQEIRDVLSASTKPLILTEGETDPKYIRTALELLGREDILNAVDVEWVGVQRDGGPLNTGQKGLDNTRNVLEANPDLSKRRVLLLYDCDTHRLPVDIDPLSVRSIPVNANNDVAKKGIENLLSSELFESRFYPSKTIVGDYGEVKTIQDFAKVKFCAWVCEERKKAEDFKEFSTVVEIVDQFLVSTNKPVTDS